ncbi:hypothetical protein FBEOM_12187 [Fusarium beomiforme]|uniref:Transcription factor domain-containing protein n=1 Tax=Fusarium beomiforme TaxID=44412 RepID=A0A9P5A854_9HYPO|nr:hypothetical protein FBEOM_12187 [Fusarium beomiforme]
MSSPGLTRRESRSQGTDAVGSPTNGYSSRLNLNPKASMRNTRDPSLPASVPGSDIMHHSAQRQQQSRFPHSASSSMDLDAWQMDAQPERRQPMEQVLHGNFDDAWLNPSLPQRDTNPFLRMGSESEPISRWQQDVLGLSRDPFQSNEIPVSPDLDQSIQGNGLHAMSEDLNFDLLGSLGILTQHQITPSQASQQQSPFSAILNTPVSTESLDPIPFSSMPSTDPEIGPKSTPNQAVETKRNESLHQAVAAIRGSTAPDPRPKYGESGRRQSCPFSKLHSDDDLIKMVRSYPSVMIRPGHYPPFVHHKLYRCAAGDVAEPLAKAFCCVGAFYASVPTSESFVYSLINEESNKLVRGFHQGPGSDSNMLAVVHAMCVYQILGFFVSTNAEQAHSAELQHMYFLKMTRRLIKLYLQSSAREDDEETNWRTWLMNETIRRTVFIVNAINTLSCRIQKQDSYYFESLDDNFVGSLTLPAPEAIWNASSVEEWRVAKSQLGSDDMARSKLTIRQAIDQIKKLGSHSTGWRNGSQLQFEHLDDFTRLIIATVEVE